ncbi:MAG: hypothetical protein ABL996_23690 [Micropepsaceae bacterium]
MKGTHLALAVLVVGAAGVGAYVYRDQLLTPNSRSVTLAPSASAPAAVDPIGGDACDPEPGDGGDTKCGGAMESPAAGQAQPEAADPAKPPAP